MSMDCKVQGAKLDTILWADLPLDTHNQQAWTASHSHNRHDGFLNAHPHLIVLIIGAVDDLIHQGLHGQYSVRIQVALPAPERLSRLFRPHTIT